MTDHSKSGKQPIIRGSRACTVCRTAKMKCVGADEEQHVPCMRCVRTNQQCKFEKHRRGRKPGSKLSEASKMLRRLEKGLNNAKAKSHHTDLLLPTPYPSMTQDASSLNQYSRPTSSGGVGAEDDDDTDKSGDNIFPAQLIRKESERNSFFKTILNPTDSDPHSPHQSSSGGSVSQASSTTTRSPSASSHHDYNGRLGLFPGLRDPVAAGLIEEKDAAVFFDLFFLRLNSFINLFDPALHTVHYVRSRSPFLFTVIIMACCKFFKPSLYQRTHKMAQEYAITAFAENWKSVEVAQAFACLTYWKEPDDTRTWTYIGYACRMAVELGLNEYVAYPQNETPLQFLERRNRERTFLVLFVHDRSLSTQTGRPWMLDHLEPLVVHGDAWHLHGGSTIRPEDVILAAFVNLRIIASDVTKKVYQMGPWLPGELINSTNERLAEWMERWSTEMKKADGEKFHHAFLRFFWLYVRLFLNSLFLKLPLSNAKVSPRDIKLIEALDACYVSGLEHLRSVVDDFAAMAMLRYGQETITVMTAYCAVFLITLLRNRNTKHSLPINARDDIYRSISMVADTYAEFADPSSATAAHHSRFLKSLVANDMFRSEQMDRMERDESETPTDQDQRDSSESNYASVSPTETDNALRPLQEYTPPLSSTSMQQSSFRFPSNSSPTSSGSAPPMLPPPETHAMPMQPETGYPTPMSASDPSLRHSLVNVNGVNGVNQYGYASNGPLHSSQPSHSSHASQSSPTSHQHIPGTFDHRGPPPRHLTNGNVMQPPQSDSEAYYFQRMFKELGMPHGFDSIYASSSPTSMSDGLGADPANLGPGSHRGMGYANGVNGANGHAHGQMEAGNTLYRCIKVLLPRLVMVLCGDSESRCMHSSVYCISGT
ncbi:unnamed protein product [Somion occarium]|uniref:Zn(2)-C6 fungal-type domain-containing protein n=1 Tax=Somion occarium TaxID=3059160 RepID=A0ABP1D7I7_9APHY